MKKPVLLRQSTTYVQLLYLESSLGTQRSVQTLSSMSRLLQTELVCRLQCNVVHGTSINKIQDQRQFY